LIANYSLTSTLESSILLFGRKAPRFLSILLFDFLCVQFLESISGALGLGNISEPRVNLRKLQIEFIILRVIGNRFLEFGQCLWVAFQPDQNPPDTAHGLLSLRVGSRSLVIFAQFCRCAIQITGQTGGAGVDPSQAEYLLVPVATQVAQLMAYLKVLGPGKKPQSPADSVLSQKPYHSGRLESGVSRVRSSVSASAPRSV
jgi:hypothetical protein